MNGIVSAWLLNSAREEGWFTREHVILYETMVSDVMPFLAAPFARWVLEALPREGFAALQLATVLGVWLLLEATRAAAPAAFVSEPALAPGLWEGLRQPPPAG